MKRKNEGLVVDQHEKLPPLQQEMLVAHGGHHGQQLPIKGAVPRLPQGISAAGPSSLGARIKGQGQLCLWNECARLVHGLRQDRLVVLLPIQGVASVSGLRILAAP